MMNASSSSDEEDAPPVKQIPGFYYDKTKKKYFKIQADGFNAPGAFTKSSLKRKKEHKHAKKQMKSLKKQRQAPTYFSNMLRYQNNFQIYGYTSTQKVLALRLHSEQSRDIHTINVVDRDEHPKSQTLLSSFGVLFNLRRGTTPCTRINMYDTDFSIPGSEKLNRVIRSEWPIDDWSIVGDNYCMTELADDTVVLGYTSGGGSYAIPKNYPTSFSIFRRCEMEDNVTRCRLLGDFKQGGYIWDTAACAGDKSSMFNVHLFEEGRTTWSNLHLVDFSHSAGNPQVAHHHKLKDVSDPVLASGDKRSIVYVGCREGRILRVDFRQRRRDRCFTLHKIKLRKNRKITSMLALNDGHTIVTSHVSGLKGLFDLRMQKFKAFNKDTVSNTVCDNSKLKTDESNTYITASGQKGGYVRIWDARNLETVKMIAAADSADTSCDLTSRHGHLSMIVTDKQSYRFYT